jgi:uncharacterized membrane protein
MANEMMNMPDDDKKNVHPFRAAVLRGMGVVAPPLLTIVIFVWVGSTINEYVLKPVTTGARETLVHYLNETRDEVPLETPPPPRDEKGREYTKLPNDTYVPRDIYEKVDKISKERGVDTPKTGRAIYNEYVVLTYLRPHYVIPFFLAVFILVLYLLGKFMAAGIGRFFWSLFERGVHRLPLVRNVYSSVKQVSDFLFSEREVEYTRVVAVEYPRKGIWALGMVTGESMLDIRSAANEPVLSVLIPTSPMPVTGFTVTVLKSETIDLNITIDQAFQFIVSCGVVVPPQQMQGMLDDKSQSGEEGDSSDGNSDEEASGNDAIGEE